MKLVMINVHSSRAHCSVNFYGHMCCIASPEVRTEGVSFILFLLFSSLKNLVSVLNVSYNEFLLEQLLRNNEIVGKRDCSFVMAGALQYCIGFAIQ